MSKLDELIAELCPDGVEFKTIKEEYTRLKGTPITAGKMKEIDNPDGEIRVFAGGKTVINAREEDIPNASAIYYCHYCRAFMGGIYFSKMSLE